MRMYLLALDMDLLAADEKLGLEPISYLIAQRERGPCEAVVLSLANTGKARLPAGELLLGAQVGKFPVAPQPRYDIGAAAEHRMNLTVRNLPRRSTRGARPGKMAVTAERNRVQVGDCRGPAPASR